MPLAYASSKLIIILDYTKVSSCSSSHCVSTFPGRNFDICPGGDLKLKVIVCLKMSSKRCLYPITSKQYPYGLSFGDNDSMGTGIAFRSIPTPFDPAANDSTLQTKCRCYRLHCIPLEFHSGKVAIVERKAVLSDQSNTGKSSGSLGSCSWSVLHKPSPAITSVPFNSLDAMQKKRRKNRTERRSEAEKKELRRRKSDNEEKKNRKKKIARSIYTRRASTNRFLKRKKLNHETTYIWFDWFEAMYTVEWLWQCMMKTDWKPVKYYRK